MSESNLLLHTEIKLSQQKESKRQRDHKIGIGGGGLGDVDMLRTLSSTTFLKYQVSTHQYHGCVNPAPAHRIVLAGIQFNQHFLSFLSISVYVLFTVDIEIP